MKCPAPHKSKPRGYGLRLGILVGLALGALLASVGAVAGYRWQQHELIGQIQAARADYATVYQSLTLAQTEIARLHTRSVTVASQAKRRAARIGG